MKHIIKISDIIGTEVRTRFSLNPLKAELKEGDEYLIDMQDVKMISRSAADELYIIFHQYNVAMVHLSDFARKMMDAVAIGRFTKRVYDTTDAKFIICENIESLNAELKKLASR